MTVVVVVVALVVVIATYLTWMARRLDRLGVRVDAAGAGLVAQLAARAEAAVALAESRGLVPLAAAAERAIAGHTALRSGASLDTGVEDTENELSRALRAPEVGTAGQGAPALLHAVDSAAARVALARQLHNDAVRDLRALRGRRLVRMTRLGSRRPLPAYFEIDDALPARGDVPASLRVEAPLDAEPGPGIPTGGTAAGWETARTLTPAPDEVAEPTP